MEKRKNKIIRQNGIEPTITYYYYTYNVIDYAGKEVVKSSFESLSGQGEEVVVSDYGFDQKTKDLAEECGLKYIWCEKDKGITFNESKVRNNVINQTDSNFLVDWNVHVEAPNDLNEKLIEWINEERVKKWMPHIRYLWIGDPDYYDDPERIKEIKEKGRKYHSFACLAYVPLLRDIRGYDERTHFCAGSQKYGVKIMADVYNVRTKDYLTGKTDMKYNIPEGSMVFAHKYHHDYKLPMRNKCFKETKRDSSPQKVIDEIRNAMNKDFLEGRKLVHNSYW